MKYFATALETLIMRDVMYIVGGATVILSGFYLYDTYLPTTYLDDVMTVSGFILFIGIGIAYAVGYVVQELSHLFHLTTVHAWSKPSKFSGWLLNIYFRQKVELEQTFVDDPFKFAMGIFTIQENDLPDKTIAFIQRYINLKHVGITLGMNFGVSTILLLFQWCMAGRLAQSLVLPIFSAILSIALLTFGRIKGLEQHKYMELVYKSPQIKEKYRWMTSKSGQGTLKKPLKKS